MANRRTTFLLKRSNVPGKVPPSSGLTSGEIALNTADAILYTSGSTANQILPIGWDRVSRTGDTVTGNFTINGGLTANTISATTYQNLPKDVFVTGGTYSNGTATFTNNTGGTFNVSGFTSGTSLNVDYIDFNTGATVTQSQGRIHWDSGTGTLNVTVGDAGTGLIDLQVGQEEIVRVYNSEATTLLKGEIVYVSGSQGNRPSVKRAQAQGDLYSVTTLGMIDRDIDSGNEGYVTTFGIISNLNTLGLTGGTPIWLSPTISGGYTSIKPQAPDHTVLIGYVVRVSATVGSIFVNISNGWELDELHDVRVSAATEGDLLVRSSYSGTPVWVNTKTLPGSYTITGNTNIGGNLIVSGNTGVNWFSSNTSSDLVRITQTGSGNSFVVEDSTNPDTTSLAVNGNGIVGVGVNPLGWSAVTSQPYVGMASTSNRVYVSGNLIAGGDKLGIGYYNSTNPFNITNVISGTSVTSSFGSLLESYENGQFVVGIRDNDPNDGFNILSHNGGYTGTSEYSKLIATFKGSGKIGLGGIKNPTETLEVSGNTFVSGSLSATTIYSDGANITNIPNKLLSMTILTASTLVTHTVGTTNFTAINLNSDATNRFAKITFVAPPSGNVLIDMTFDMTIVNSAAVQMIGLNTTTGSTSTPSDGWYRVNADNDSTSGQFYAKFIKTNLTPGVTYTYYFMGVCNFSSNTIRISSVQTGSYSAGSDLPSPLIINVYDLGGVTITTNPSS